MAADKLVFGLVLSGGKSQRMGQDKAAIAYHGLPQRDYLVQLLTKFCSQVFVSIRPEQEQELPSEFKFLPDSHTVPGPLNGILSAMQAFPEAAWLVVACDLPLVTTKTIQKLIGERDPEKLATVYALQDSDLPEPMLAIWEPEAYPEILKFVAEGKACPRKFLMNQAIKIIRPEHDEELYNANKPEDLEFIKNLLHDANSTL